MTRLAAALDLDTVERERLIAAARTAVRQGDELDAASAATTGTPRAWVVPRLLPYAVHDFTGREEQVERLVTALSSAAAPDGAPAVVISAVEGMGGVGKTTLALHAAQLVRDRFPDGQLFADLRGTAAVPADPSSLLAMFLRQLGVDNARLPADEVERSALYRSLLADRRVLILLDDARDAAQVRPLIPGTPGCAILVTVRNHMTGLAGTDVLHLDVLPERPAYQLLCRIIGSDRVAAEPEAARAVLAECAGLPLAIRLVGGRLTARPSWRIQDIADCLHATRRRLDELRLGDQSIRASFELSYAGLGEDPAARAFCFLGLWTGPDISLPAAASLLGEPADEAERVLEQLVDVHLVQSSQRGRYSLHGLLRAYAAELAENELDASATTAAITRLVTWYARATSAVDVMLAPRRQRIVPDSVPGLASPPDLCSAVDAIEWCEREQANLVSAIRLARVSGLQPCWSPTALHGLFQQRRGDRFRLRPGAPRPFAQVP